MWIVSIILSLIVIFLGIGTANYLVSVLGIGIMIISFWNMQKAKANKKARKAEQQAEIEYISKQIEAVQRGELPIVHDTPVLLNSGEFAHLSMRAVRSITKNKAVGRTGGFGGVRFRVAKGVSLYSGTGRSRNIYQDVTDSFSGQLIVTNQRLLFINSQQGFECKLKDISAITETGNDGVTIQTNGKAYSLSVVSQMLLTEVLRILRSQKAV